MRAQGVLNQAVVVNVRLRNRHCDSNLGHRNSLGFDYLCYLLPHMATLDKQILLDDNQDDFALHQQWTGLRLIPKFLKRKVDVRKVVLHDLRRDFARQIDNKSR